ncbi:hypothetical protein COV56_03025 [Candidatus Kuenenbacteria bacterium CG11_big_fil_rev_8_21_14_0_20_37_9]|uniref:Transglutaminase-like domain-containing protein n=1 Tax=Candidatus Kuenenbacteria bacterium CG08_land_8_20_14_0_20_37_23 TaxID=1974617 RepID=A0A2M6XTF0_9BACT|nr:MAG: hypothetical protein COV56_03025 [Candidatus Kuenenbacteria bacterium CG11_big_fil_rev_8_21_14_0_20_37_9]PIU10928.1 MAG: hypothetical protein COT27_00585 [Candidatus Kuenenbacteria bacterium CG08_land_8_20_14_0_20_37_23]
MPLDLFSKTPIPDVLPNEMQKIINEIKKSLNKEECLKSAYKLLVAKYRGYRVMTYLKFFDVFKHDIGAFWSKNGFLHCTNINYVMRTLLVKSGFFTEDDIRLRWTQIWYISPHQYLQVKIDDKWINIDIWVHAYGIKFGDHSHGFH